MQTPKAPGALPPRGLLLLAALVLVWGTQWPVMKVAVAEIPVFSFRALCVVFGAAGVFLIVAMRGERLAVPRRQWRALVLASLLNMTGWFYFSALALTLIPAGRAAIVAYTVPLWAFLLGIPVLKERPSWAQWLGLAMGLGGVALLFADDLAALRGQPLGVAVMLGGAMSFGFGAVVQKRVRWQTPLLALTGWQLAIGGVPLVVAAAVVDRGALGPVSWLAIAAVTCTIVLGIIFGFTVWLRLVSLLPVQAAALATLLIPVVGVLSSAALLGEAIGWREVTALVLLVAAVSRVIPLPALGPFLGRKGPAPTSLDRPAP